MNQSTLNLQKLFDNCRELTKIDSTYFGDYELEDRTLRLAVTFSKIHSIMIIRMNAKLPEHLDKTQCDELASIVEEYNSKNTFGQFRLIHVCELNSITYTIHIWTDGKPEKESLENILQQSVVSIKGILYDMEAVLGENQ